ncbi:polysaccharide export protein [Rippkaea orientalis PCC 8801]|uniref:Polysaccharide export protein n=1 Tax=Rippkaea orientalis (strain PCC 8801 / RF-1) TaxID=41431 RepID=B7JUL9_RIPO1|nr:SLBB domain-containing protein [Rippkaea orientalis]ACK65563.1 polysaccharide export protein [Rippkaea orientalis PCC 8801]
MVVLNPNCLTFSCSQNWLKPIVILSWVIASPLMALPLQAQPYLSPLDPIPPLQPFPSQPSVPSTETEYSLGAGDRIAVNVFPVQEFSGQYTILVDGTLSMPIVGSLPVEGLTLSQLTEFLTREYSQYLKRPIITISLIAPRPLKVAIAGEINSPGSYLLPVVDGQKFPTVSQLIQQAGGLTTVADLNRVQIRRQFKGESLILSLNLWQLLQQGNLNQDITLRDGDTVIIPTQETIDLAQTRLLSDANFGLSANQEINVAIVGEVYRPGSYRVIPQSTTTGNTQTTRRQPPRLTLAIQLAGGIKPLADIRQVEIRRFNRDGSQQKIMVDLWNLLQTGNIEEDVILQAGDTISIPTAKDLPTEESEPLATASFSPATIRVNVVGEVRRPGLVEVPPNIPLNQAILAAGGFDTRRADQGTIEVIRLNYNGTVTKREIDVDFAQGITEANNPILRNNDVVIVNRNLLTTVSDTLVTVFSPLGALTGLFNFFNIFGAFDD